MNTSIVTDRLHIRPFVLSDAAFIIQLLNSEGWLKYIGDRKITSIEAAENYLQNVPIKMMRENGFGLMCVERKDHPTPIGMCGILKRDTLDFPDIGFAFLDEFSGQGFAYEAAKACENDFTNRFQPTEIQAITVEYNHRSRKLLEKLGMTFEKKFRMENDPEELLLYTKKYI